MLRLLRWAFKWSAIAFLVLLLFVMAVGIVVGPQDDRPAQHQREHR